ncbi:glutamate receptor ionotropic, kainate 2-like [Bolinopsis microptera]|uniref:glutamate receptor ionotropic, kainate 2-like n=1 Tax=Bolinopsis microptera TaxID=2820187 RepID=UPI00307AC44D
MAGLHYILFFILYSIGQPYKVGLLLNSEEQDGSNAIKSLAQYTISKLNKSNTKLQLVERYHDSTYLNVMNNVCELIDENVVAIISGSDSTLTAIQVNMANQFHVPLVAAVATNPFLEPVSKENFELRLSPSDVFQSQAIFDLLKEYNWYQFSILASADDYGINSIVHLQYLASQDDNFSIRDVQHFDVRKDLSDSENSSFFEKELQLIKDSIAKVIVLNCDGKFAKIIFREAERKGLMDESFVWITTDAITSKPETMAYDDLSYPSFYQGLIGTLPHYGKGSKQYKDLADGYIMTGGKSSDLHMSSVKVSMGLEIVHFSLKELDEGEWDNSPSVSCKTPSYWVGGEELFSKMDENFQNGAYDNSGVVIPTYDILNFQEKGFEKIGKWENSSGLVNLGKDETILRWVDRKDVLFSGNKYSPPSGIGNTLTGYHLRIGIVPEPPIAYFDEKCGNNSSPDCWYGWNPDIIKKLQEDLNFTYEYVQPADNKYGGFNKVTKEWNGMIRDILDRKTDLTIALSINTERSKYIDYTASFYEDQAAFIVHTKTSKSSSNMFFFLEPFELSVWISIIGLILVIALLTTFFSKFSPFGKYGRTIHAMQSCACAECVLRREIKVAKKCRFVDTKTYSCLVEKVEEDDEMNELSYYNSTWLIGTGFVLQGTDTLPTAPSGRFLLFMWWLFIMILTSMYTANLTAHLTLDRSTATITKLDDLLNQGDYKWGLINDRNLQTMMSDHEDETYNKIVSSGVGLESLDEGITRVKKGDFVFIDDSSVLTFNFRGDCQAALTKTGKFNNQWALGTQVNSPYSAVINSMFLQYRERGWFTTKFDEWYNSADENIQTCSSSVGSDAKFGIPILGGLFLILGVGAVIAFVTVFLEILYVSHLDSIEKGQSIWQCLWKRIVYKYREVTEEWFDRSHKRVEGHDSNGFDRNHKEEVISNTSI